jgi:hypothetical protein
MLANCASIADHVAPMLRASNVTRYERLVDPEGKLEPVERERRAAYARKAHMLKLAAKSAKVRAARTAARKAAS